jgi:sarcosine oxidase
VLAWEAAPSRDRVCVTTERGSYEAARLVIAAGAWAPELLRDLGLPLTVQRNVLYWFQPVDGRAAFLPGRCPIYIWEAEDGSSFYGFPALPGSPGGVKVALHNFGPLCTPATVDRQVHEGEVAHIRAWMAERIPSQHPQVVIASPCSGHGYKFASVVGEVLADLAIDGATRHPIEWFAPTRFATTS